MVKVNTFDLREASHYKVSALVAIRFDVENPVIVYDFVAFQHLDEFKHVLLPEHT